MHYYFSLNANAKNYANQFIFYHFSVLTPAGLKAALSKYCQYYENKSYNAVIFFGQGSIFKIFLNKTCVSYSKALDLTSVKFSSFLIIYLKVLHTHILTKFYFYIFMSYKYWPLKCKAQTNVTSEFQVV